MKNFLKKLTKRATACEMSQVAEFKLGSGRAYTVPVIYWHLAEHTPDLDAAGNIESFRKAFADWQPLLDPIKLESTSDPRKANITIYFAVNGDRDLPIPFSGSTLAYAYFPIRNKSKMYFNDAYEWGMMHDAQHTNLRKVATHEIGHSLNIGHSVVRGDIMEAVYAPNNEVKLTKDTWDAVEALYGPLKRRLRQNNPERPRPAPKPEEPGVQLSQETKAILAIIFPNKYALYRLTPAQLVVLAKHLKLNAGGGRRVLVEKIYSVIR